jgi:DNA-binding GntR family transcriptional regulator
MSRIRARNASDKTGGRLGDAAYEWIKRDIVRCVLRPGADVTETELGDRYKTGKAPVRAALLRLRQDGLIRALPRRGYKVGAITVHGVNDVFEMRMLLEPGAARLAVGRVDGELLSRLRTLCQSLYTTGDRESEEAFLRANRDFHVSLAQATGNERLAAAIADLLDATERLVYLGLRMKDRISGLLEEHTLLLDAVAAGDADRAAAIASAHVEASRKIVLDAIYTTRGIPDVSVVR